VALTLEDLGPIVQPTVQLHGEQKVVSVYHFKSDIEANDEMSGESSLLLQLLT